MQVSSIYTLLAILGAFALTSADPYGDSLNYGDGGYHDPNEPSYHEYNNLVKRSPGGGDDDYQRNYQNGGGGNPPLRGPYPIAVGEGTYYKIYSAHHKTCMTAKKKLFRLGSGLIIHRKSHYKMQTKKCDRDKAESASGPLTFQLIPTDEKYVKIVWQHLDKKFCAKEAATGTWFEDCNDKFTRYSIAEINAQGQFKIENGDRGNQCLVAKMLHAMRSRSCDDKTPQMLWEAVPVHGS